MSNRGKVSAEELAAGGSGPPLRSCDPLLFFEALLPIEKIVPPPSRLFGASGPPAVAKAMKPVYCPFNVLDTITVIDGEPRVWALTQPDGNVVQKKIFDRASIMTSWRQHGA